MTFRWFGAKSDTVTLRQIKQIPGVTGVMGFLDYKAAGAVWEEAEIAAFIEEVKAAGLACEVIESVNLHEDIKLGLPSREGYIEAYITTVRNLAKYGVKVIVYSFMPVFDWLRTDLARLIPTDGSYAFYYDERELEGLGPADIVRRMAADGKGFSLPGWEPARLLELETTLARYKNITPDILRENYRYFLSKIIPVCEQCGVRMACHPDDPAWPVFDLPRIGYDRECLDKILELHPSPAHALCLCAGSLASSPQNDIPAMIRRFGGMGRVACLHLRNVKKLGHRHFREASHLSADGDLDMYEAVLAMYEACPDVYVRPDHGRMIWGEQARPGYGLYDRALGAAYLNGLWEAVTKAAR